MLNKYHQYALLNKTIYADYEYLTSYYLRNNFEH